MNKSRKILLILIALLSCLLLGLLVFLGWNWYDAHVDRSGWKTSGGATVYADFHGDPVTGWQDIQGSRYYFDADHSLHTGWLDTGEGRFYLGQDGILRTGWQTIDGDRYYFDERGLLQTGWITVADTRHYFLENGVLASGWQQTPEGTCYLDDNGVPVSGWLTWEQTRYCFDEQGFPYTGWLELEGERYYLSEAGAAHTGWLEADGCRYYFGDTCAMVTGWQTIDGDLYYFTETGAMYTGWLEEGEYRRYLLPDGTAATGKQEIDGETCYFTPNGIWVLLCNPWNFLPDDYAPELVETERGFRVAAQCQNALDAMFAAMREEGLIPMISSAYRSKADQIGIWNSYVNRYLASGYTTAQANAMTAAYVAAPGTSEHHTGLAVDIVGYDYYYDGHYGATREVHAWLAEHCWEYGFILRYTEEKQSLTGVAAEPWHFRYVGTLVSMDMKDTGLCLEEYLSAPAQ